MLKPRFIYTMDGSFILSYLFAPSYILSNHLFTANHFFISIKLHFPNRSSISTYAMIDESGATTSSISDSFATHHSLSRCLKDVSIPIIAVDDWPIASGLITQDVLTNISISSHSESQALTVITVSYPIILGLDWLQHHNPNIDWHESHLILNCCGLNPAKPTKVYVKGFSPLLQPNSVHLTSVGLGLSLSIPVISLFYLASSVPLSPPSFKQELSIPSSASCVSFQIGRAHV